MYESILHDIGLSINEARVYESMVALDEVNVATISLKSGVHRRNVYDSLNKLMERGLVTQLFVKGERQFKALDPSRLSLIIKEKEDALKNILPDLKNKFSSIKQEEQAYIYRGIQGYKNYMQDILDVGEDFYCIGGKGGWFDPRLTHFRAHFYKELEKKNLNAFHLFDHELRDHQKKDIASPINHHLHQSRFLPPSGSTTSALDFFGDRVVLYTGLNINKVDDNIVIFVLVSRELCENMKKWFWTMWEACPSD